jgi:hypothetical protein
VDVIRRAAAAFVGSAAVAGLVLLPARSGAASVSSFAGSCAFTGVETFSPPLTLLNRAGRAQVTAAGHCSGTLVDASGVARRVTAAAAAYQQGTAATTISCLGGTAAGTGVITIDGIALDFAVTEPQLTVVSALRYTAATWDGLGIASVAPTADPLSLVRACAGSGITSVPVVLFATVQAHAG